MILWGAGQLAMKLLALSAFAQTRVSALVDNNPILRGKTISRAPIIGPREIASTREPIIIATLLHAGEIVEQIRRLGLGNPVLCCDPALHLDANSEASR